LVITEKLGEELVRKTHYKYGHIGAKHIRNILTPYYSFSRIGKIIAEVCGLCEIKNKSRIRSEKGSMGHLGPAKEPFEVMSLDSIGGFGGSRSTKKYIHLFVDHFTRFAYILTSATQSSTDFIKLVTKVSNEQPIKVLLTDQYGGLCSGNLKNF